MIRLDPTPLPSSRLLKKTMAEEEPASTGTMALVAGNQTEDPTGPACMRFVRLPGSEPAKQNDVIVCGDVGLAGQHVIYFGGDVQVR